MILIFAVSNKGKHQCSNILTSIHLFNAAAVLNILPNSHEVTILLQNQTLKQQSYPANVINLSGVWVSNLMPSLFLLSLTSLTMPLAIFYRCTAQFVADVFGNPKDSFFMMQLILNTFDHENMSVECRPPYTPLLYSKTGVYSGTHYFLIFAVKHRL